MSFLQKILAYFRKEPMADTEAVATETVTETPVPTTPVVPAADPVVAVAAEPEVNLEALKKVLVALGHELDEVWDEAVALARKV